MLKRGYENRQSSWYISMHCIRDCTKMKKYWGGLEEIINNAVEGLASLKK